MANSLHLNRRDILRIGAAASAFAAMGGHAAFAAGSLKFMTANQAWCEALSTLVSPAYQKDAGIDISVDQNAYDALYTKAVVELSQGSSTYDFLNLDCMWIRQAVSSDWALCLEDMKAADPSLPDINYKNIIPPALSYVTVADKHYGLPMTCSMPVMVYRKDLLEKAGIENPPSTWEEYLEAAKKMHSSEVAGTCLLAGGQDSFSSGDFGSRLMSMVKLAPSDDGFTDAEGNPVFNSEGQGEAALELLKELTQYCPAGFENFDYPDGTSVLQQGSAAMLVTWSDCVVGIEDGPHKGKFGYAVAPLGKFKQSQVGGMQLIANKNSKNPAEAYKFLAWLANGGYRYYREGKETSLVFAEDVNNPANIEAIPMLQAFQAFNSSGLSSCAVQFYRVKNALEAQRALYEEMVAGLTGQKSSKDAMAAAQDRIAKLKA
jgi:multiple sugar transport system substrate-binding protein